MDDGEPVAEPLCLVEVVRRHEDRQLISTLETRDQIQQFVPDSRIQADSRLVEEEDARARNESARQLETSALAAAVGGNRAVDECAESERRHDLVDAMAGLALLD